MRNGMTRIGTWNVRSLAGKEVELNDEMKKLNIKMLGITETKKKGVGIQKLDGSTLIYSGVDKKERAKAGVAMIIADELFEQADYNFINERLIEVNVELKDKNIKVITAYGPNEDASKEEKEDFLNQLQLAVENVKPNQEVMILGDLNARVGNKGDANFNVIGKEGEIAETENGEKLIEFCIRNKLKIANTFFKHKDIHKWTRVAETRGERSIIDYIIVTNSLFYSTHDVRVMRGAEIYFLVVAKMNILPKQKDKKSKMSKRSKLMVEKLKDTLTQLAYQNSIKAKLEQQTATESLEHLWLKYKNALNESANEVCGRKIIGGNKKRTAWWSEEVKRKVKEKKDAWKKYLASKNLEDYEIYKVKRKAAKEEVRKSKQNEWEKFGEKLEKDFNDNQKLFWGAMKRCRKGNSSSARHVKNSNGEMVKDEDEILDTWKEYFQNLHNVSGESNTDNLNQT